jgi:hypothetical protein
LEELADTFDENPARRQAAVLARMQEEPTEYQPPVIPLSKPSVTEEKTPAVPTGRWLLLLLLFVLLVFYPQVDVLYVCVCFVVVPFFITVS